MAIGISSTSNLRTNREQNHRDWLTINATPSCHARVRKPSAYTRGNGFQHNTNAQLPALEMSADFTQHKLSKTKTSNHPNDRRVNCSTLILIMASSGGGICPKMRAHLRVPSLNGLATSPIPRRLMMRFYKQQHQFYCGIDLHAKSMHLCLVNQAGDVLVHRNLAT
jgi:hypothetical protein